MKYFFLFLASLWIAQSPLKAAFPAVASSSKTHTTLAEKKLKEPSWKLGDPLTLQKKKITLDGQVRERFEWRQNWFDFNDSTDWRDDVALLHRIRFGVKMEPNDEITAYVQCQDSRTFFDEPAGGGVSGPTGRNREFTTTNSPFDLRHAYVQIHQTNLPLTFKLGRQSMSYGEQRLIGPGEWDNNTLAFDAIKVTYKQGSFWIDYFAAYPVLHKTEDFNNPDTEDLFTGFYGGTEIDQTFILEGFLLFRSKSDVELSTVFTNDPQCSGNITPAGDYFTLGTHFANKPKPLGGWDFHADAVLQVGQVSNPVGLVGITAEPINTKRQDLLAGAFQATAGYTFQSVLWTPRLYLDYCFSSGDDNPQDKTSHTLQNLFPSNHAIYGLLDRFSWKNMHNPGFGLHLKPTTKLSIEINNNFFWLDETKDPWYSSNQNVLGGAPRYNNALLKNPNPYVGAETDCIVRYQPINWTSFVVGYSHFFPGDYIRATSAPPGVHETADGADFIFTQWTLNF